METPSTPKQDTDATAVQPKRPVHHVETTGQYWGDVWEAFKRISIFNDSSRIGEIPCMRNSLMSGIASGVGIGFIRGFNASPWVAANWSVATFVCVSIGTWEICQKNLRQERQRVQQVVETLPKRFAKQQAGKEGNESGSAGA